MTIVDRRIEALEAENAQLRDLLSRSWTIIHKRAHVVLPGDLVANESGKTWQVTKVETNAFETTINMLASNARLIELVRSRDTAVPVLAPIPMRDGIILLRGGLGAQLIPIDDVEDEEIEMFDALGTWRDGQVHTCPLHVHPHVALRECVKYALDHGDRTYVGDPSFVPLESGST